MLAKITGHSVKEALLVMRFEEKERVLKKTLATIDKQYKHLASIPEYLGDDFNEMVLEAQRHCLLDNSALMED